MSESSAGQSTQGPWDWSANHLPPYLALTLEPDLAAPPAALDEPGTLGPPPRDPEARARDHQWPEDGTTPRPVHLISECRICEARATSPAPAVEQAADAVVAILYTADDGPAMMAEVRAVLDDLVRAAEQRGAEGLHEWRCPGCGAVTRARMADEEAPAGPVLGDEARRALSRHVVDEGVIIAPYDAIAALLSAAREEGERKGAERGGRVTP
jgi:hypothetical protein